MGSQHLFLHGGQHRRLHIYRSRGRSAQPGLLRATWIIIGDKSSRSFASRLGLARTLILFQSVLGLIMSIAFVSAARNFADGFVPVEVWDASLTYIRISSFSALSSAIETAIANSTRAVDHSDVPLIISSVKFLVNIIFDLLRTSTFHVGNIKPAVNMQALIQLAYNTTSASSAFAISTSPSASVVETQMEHSTKSSLLSKR
jgi:hypothetical protein